MSAMEDSFSLPLLSLMSTLIITSWFCEKRASTRKVYGLADGGKHVQIHSAHLIIDVKAVASDRIFNKCKPFD